MKSTRSWAAVSAALFALNAFLCRELFVTEYTQHLGSIEAAFIGLSRYIVEHGPTLGWFPLWYGGIPFANSYPPLMHHLVAAAAWWLDISPALAHHGVSALFYCLGPVMLFWMADTLSKDRWASLAAAAAYSLVSPAIALSPEIASWAGSPWNPARLQALVRFGEGPHIMAVALLPLAIIALHAALERTTPWRIYVAALGLAAVVLTNWIGGFALALAAVSYLLARAGEPTWGWKLAVSAGIAAVAFGMAAPWLTPTTLDAVLRNAQVVEGDYQMTGVQAAAGAILLILAGLTAYALVRARAPLALRFACLFSLFTGAVALSSGWAGVHLIPQPERYAVEMEMGLCLAAALGAAPLLRRLRPRVLTAVVCGLSGVLLFQVFSYRRMAGDLIRSIDMTQTLEYQASTWLGENFPGQRVFLTGSVQFWLNAFADTPQVGGGYAQGIINDQISVVHYGVPFTQGDGERTVMWLRLHGTSAVAVSGPRGRDYYPENWHDPLKFEGVLPELWRDGEDIIYAVPRRSDSLAHVILPEHVAERFPINVEDVGPVTPLDGALEDSSLPLAEFTWRSSDEAVILATMSPEQLLFVQISHHHGWKALVGDKEAPIRRDGLGMMVIEPGCEGPCEVRLLYDGGAEMLIAKTASVASLLGGLGWVLYGRFRRRTAGP